MTNHVLYYVENETGEWLIVHDFHPRLNGESFCGAGGLVSVSPMYVVTCPQCAQLRRKEQDASGSKPNRNAASGKS